MNLSGTLKHSLLSSNRGKHWKDHSELAAAILSGLLVLFAWYGESHWDPPIYIGIYLAAFLIGGYAKAKEGITETLKERELNVELLMILAAVGSASIGYWMEGAILIFIFSLSGALETYTMNKSQKELSSLMSLQPTQALLVTNTGYEWTDVSTLHIGDRILVKPGERLPADGVITRGASSIDESAITGEAAPIYKQTDGEVYAGTMNMEASIVVHVTKKANDTLFQKIIHMVQHAQSERSPSQLFIERFESLYVKGVLAAVSVMLFLPHFLFGWTWMETIYRAMILLVVASPCALVASIMPATLSAITHGARNGILYKGGVHLEHLAHIRAVAFDKTGTLTKGKPSVTEFIVENEKDKQTCLAVAASLEEHSNHPLAESIMNYAEQHKVNTVPIESVQNHSGYGLEGTYDGDTWLLGKAEFVGREEAAAFKSQHEVDFESDGKTVIFLKKNQKIVALFAAKDTVREISKKAVRMLKDQGIYTLMLTGDNSKTAKAIAEEAGIDQYIAECLPDQKLKEINELKKRFPHVAMVGDGINDAPALAAADVGIAMGEGTDVALETSDVVLMKNDLRKITQSIHLSKRMNRIIKQNVIFSILVITLLIISNFLQFLDLPLGVIGHEGSTILVILNGLRLLRN